MRKFGSWNVPPGVRMAGNWRPANARCWMRAPVAASVIEIGPLFAARGGRSRVPACPFGCEPDRWLTQQQFDDLQARIADVAGPSVHPRPFVGARAATTEEYRRSTEAADALLERGSGCPIAGMSPNPT